MQDLYDPTIINKDYEAAVKLSKRDINDNLIQSYMMDKIDIQRERLSY